MQEWCPTVKYKEGHRDEGIIDTLPIYVEPDQHVDPRATAHINKVRWPFLDPTEVAPRRWTNKADFNLKKATSATRNSLTCVVADFEGCVSPGETQINSPWEQLRPTAPGVPVRIRTVKTLTKWRADLIVGTQILENKVDVQAYFNIEGENEAPPFSGGSCKINALFKLRSPYSAYHNCAASTSEDDTRCAESPHLGKYHPSRVAGVSSDVAACTACIIAKNDDQECKVGAQVVPKLDQNQRNKLVHGDKLNTGAAALCKSFMYELVSPGTQAVTVFATKDGGLKKAIKLFTGYLPFKATRTHLTNDRDRGRITSTRATHKLFPGEVAQEWAVLDLSQAKALNLAEIEDWFVGALPEEWRDVLNNPLSAKMGELPVQDRAAAFPGGLEVPAPVAGETCDQTVVITMPAYEGKDLRYQMGTLQGFDYAKTAKFALKIVSDLLVAVYGLQAASRGHLDIKPDNVFFDQPIDRGDTTRAFRALLGDYGQSRMYARNGKNRAEGGLYFSENSRPWRGPEIPPAVDAVDPGNVPVPQPVGTVQLDKSDVMALGRILQVIMDTKTEGYDGKIKMTELDALVIPPGTTDKEQRIEAELKRVVAGMQKNGASLEERWSVPEARFEIAKARAKLFPDEQTTLQDLLAIKIARAQVVQKVVAKAMAKSTAPGNFVFSSEPHAAEHLNDYTATLTRCFETQAHLLDKTLNGFVPLAHGIKAELSCIPAEVGQLMTLHSGFMKAIEVIEENGVKAAITNEYFHGAFTGNAMCKVALDRYFTKIGQDDLFAYLDGYAHEFHQHRGRLGFDVMTKFYKELSGSDGGDLAREAVTVGIFDAFANGAACTTLIKDTALFGDNVATEDHGEEISRVLRGELGVAAKIVAITGETGNAAKAVLMLRRLVETEGAEVIQIAASTNQFFENADVVRTLVDLSPHCIFVIALGNQATDVAAKKRTNFADNPGKEGKHCTSTVAAPDAATLMGVYKEQAKKLRLHIVLAVNFENDLTAPTICSNFPGRDADLQNMCVGFPGASVPIPSSLGDNKRLSYQVGTSEASPRIAAMVARAVAEAKELKLHDPVHAAYKAIMLGAVHGKEVDVALGEKFLVHDGTTAVETKMKFVVAAPTTINKHGAQNPSDGAYDTQTASALYGRGIANIASAKAHLKKMKEVQARGHKIKTAVTSGHAVRVFKKGAEHAKKHA